MPPMQTQARRPTSSEPESRTRRPPQAAAPEARSPGAPHDVLPDVLLARDVEAGVMTGEARAGRWVRVRRGAYLPAEDADHLTSPHPADQERAHLARVAAVDSQVRHRPVFSHESAVVLWGGRLWRPPGAVHVTQAASASGRRSGDIVRHRAALATDDVTTVRGVRATTPARTAADCAVSLRPAEALVVCDSFLRLGVERDEIAVAVAARGTANGTRLARWVVASARGGSESAGESLARYVLLAHGLPAPELQVPVQVGPTTYRADLGWPEWRLLVEFDGLVKYRELAGGRPADVVVAEKRRQDALEDAGYRVVRATFADVASGELVRRVLARVHSDVVRSLAPRRELLLPRNVPWRTPR